MTLDNKNSTSDGSQPTEASAARASVENGSPTLESTATSPEFRAQSVSDKAATTTAPESQQAKNEEKSDEAENRRTRLASNLLEQKHSMIADIGSIIVAVIVALYLIFAVTLISLLLSGRAFDQDLPITTVVLVAMCGSIPTILSIALLVGLLSKEKEAGKDEKSIIDSSMIAKACFEFVKFLKAPH